MLNETQPPATTGLRCFKAMLFVGSEAFCTIMGWVVSDMLGSSTNEKLTGAFIGSTIPPVISFFYNRPQAGLLDQSNSTSSYRSTLQEP